MHMGVFGPGIFWPHCHAPSCDYNDLDSDVETIDVASDPETAQAVADEHAAAANAKLVIWRIIRLPIWHSEFPDDSFQAHHALGELTAQVVWCWATYPLLDRDNDERRTIVGCVCHSVHTAALRA